jgi:hypothetical protein
MSEHTPTPSKSLCDTCDTLTDTNGVPGHFIMCPLHAAAPALLAALEQLVAASRVNQNWAKARTAIAKAKGE